MTGKDIKETDLKMTKDEMKNRISMALKDPILQQGFEIICKENEELKAFVNAPFTKGSKTTRKDYIKTVWNLSKQPIEAKEIILTLLNNFAYPIGREDWTVEDEEIVDKAEQFLKEE